MYLHTYICIDIRIYIYVCIRIYTHACTHIYTRIYVWIYIFKYVCIHVFTQINLCIAIYGKCFLTLNCTGRPFSSPKYCGGEIAPESEANYRLAERLQLNSSLLFGVARLRQAALVET